MPRIRYKVTLEEPERQMLKEITTRGRHSSQKVLNALILLKCDEGRFQDRKLTNQAIADVLPVSLKKIDRVKRRFVEQGLEGALDKRKPERTYRRKADGDFEAHLIAVSCGKPPPGHARWSLRLLADRMVELEYVDAVSYETVRRVLKKRISVCQKTPLSELSCHDPPHFPRQLQPNFVQEDASDRSGWGDWWWTGPDLRDAAIGRRSRLLGSGFKG